MMMTIAASVAAISAAVILAASGNWQGAIGWFILAGYQFIDAVEKYRN